MEEQIVEFEENNCRQMQIIEELEMRTNESSAPEKKKGGLLSRILSKL